MPQNDKKWGNWESRPQDRQWMTKCFLCAVAGPSGHYPNQVCDGCDHKALATTGLRAKCWYESGDNPIFINGFRCWRRYKFGGWIAMADPENHTSLESFYVHHGIGYERDTDCPEYAHLEPDPIRHSRGFNNYRIAKGFEGGAVFTGEQDGKWWIITDETMVQDFLPDENLGPLKSARGFETGAARTAYMQERGWLPKANHSPGIT